MNYEKGVAVAWLRDKLPGLAEECKDCEGEIFWSRYWSGYHRAHEYAADAIEAGEHLKGNDDE